MKLFLDDVRNPSDCIKYMYMRIGIQASVYEEEGWLVVRNYHAFTRAMNEYGKQIKVISFDHDLAHEHYDATMMQGRERYEQHLKNISSAPTGYECALFAEQYYRGSIIRPQILVHSMNPVGVERIKSVFKL